MWLRPRVDPCAKFRANSSIGGFLANGWITTKIFLVLFTLLTDLQVRPPGRFSRAMVRTTRPHARVCFFRGRKFKVNIQPLKNSLKVENSAQKLTLKLSAKTLMYKNFTYKRPLVDIVSSQKLYRRYSPWKSKYVVILGPLFTGHMTRRMRSELFDT